MVNVNGNISDNTTLISIHNRGFRYGDALFETIKVVNSKILFWEDHYFRLMASMRILRMDIPMHYTMEFLESQILKTIQHSILEQASVKVRFYVYRNEGGLYMPTNKDVSFLITAEILNTECYFFDTSLYEVDLFKDYFISPDLLSTLKTNNKILQVVGSLYAKENNLNNCLVLNTNKQVVEALNANVFILKGNTLKTPPLSDGCLNGVMRKQVLEIAKKINGIDVVVASISPFELQKVDEIFLTNTVTGIQSITKYKKKYYTTTFAERLLHMINEKIKED